MSEAAVRPGLRPAGFVGLLSAVALLLLPACGGGGAADSAETAGSAATASSETEHTHEGSGEHAHEGTGGHTHATAADTIASDVRLAPGADDGWTASATVLSVGDSLRLLVSVEGSDAGVRHRVELLAGSCESPGSELASLTPVATGSSGAGSSQTTLPGSRTAGHAHGALRVTAADGSPSACAPVHLGGEHTHQ